MVQTVHVREAGYLQKGTREVYTGGCIPTRVPGRHIQGGVYPPGCLSQGISGGIPTRVPLSGVQTGVYPPGCLSRVLTMVYTHQGASLGCVTVCIPHQGASLGC